jgi:hypothetical protein
MKRHVLIFGVVGGLLIATLQYTEYRFVIIEPSVRPPIRELTWGAAGCHVTIRKLL